MIINISLSELGIILIGIIFYNACNFVFKMFLEKNSAKSFFDNLKKHNKESIGMIEEIGKSKGKSKEQDYVG